MPDIKKWDKQQTKRGASFLQSSYWAGFQKSLGNNSHFIEADHWSCLLIERETRFGKYLFAPYGPTAESAGSLSESINQLSQFGRSAQFDWLRLEPIEKSEDIPQLKQRLREAGARPSPRLVEPDLTSIVNLVPPVDDILASISQSTRSLIRKNQREGFLTFKTSSDQSDINVFIKMLASVSKRNRVYFFPDEYFKKQAKLLMPAGVMHIELAFQDSKPIAASIIHDYGQLANYTYAASFPEARKTSASALLLWQALLNAKTRGIKKFDLHGLAPDNAPHTHPWYGFTSFKKKFGGQTVEHAGTWDIPLTSRYRLYRVSVKARAAFQKIR